VAYGYSNIFVTAPSPENLKTVFEFIVKGLNALKYSEHLDFEVRRIGVHGQKRIVEFYDVCRIISKAIQ